VVFRGFGPHSEILVFTDLRSAKCIELARQPRAEICWYLPKTREQFRLNLHIVQHGADAVGTWATLRERSWHERGAHGQAEWLGAMPDSPLPEPVREFILIAGRVDGVEHLELRQTPQRRTRYCRADDDVWHIL
jgi:hypothetical protein